MQVADAGAPAAVQPGAVEVAARHESDDRWLVAALLVTVVFFWGMTYVFLRVAMRYSPPEVFAVARTLTGGALLCALAVALRRPFPRGWRTHAWLLACAVTGYSMFYAGMNYGASLVSAGETSLLIYSQPFWIALLARWYLGQPLSRVRVAGLVIGFAGVAIVALGKIHVGAMPAWNAYIALTAGTIAFSFSAVWFVRNLRGIQLEWAVGLQNLYGGLALIPAWLLLDHGRMPVSVPELWIAFVFTTIGSTLLAGMAYSSLLRRRDAAVTSGFTFLVPVVATVAGLVFLGETVSAVTVVGGSAVAAGIYLVNRPVPRRQAPAAAV